MTKDISDIISNFQKSEDYKFTPIIEQHFDKIIQLALSNCQIAAKATWIINTSNLNTAKNITPFINKIINLLPKVTPGHQRELLKLIAHCHLSEKQEGKLYDFCIVTWKNTTTIPSVRYYAFLQIFTFIKKYPDLFRELSFLLTDEYLNTLSPGIRKSVVKHLKNLKIHTN